MIIGNGMLAKAFVFFDNKEDVYIFASGVSNSQETNGEAFLREKNLLKDILIKAKNKTLIYFSTCSIYDQSMKNSPYVQHKIDMEKLIETNHQKYYIFRLPQVVGKTSSPTIVNYFFNKILSEEEFYIWKNSSRNLIDVEDVFKIVFYIYQEGINRNEIIDIASPHNTSILDIVNIIERISGNQAKYCFLDKGYEYNIDVTTIKPIIQLLQLNFFNNYVYSIIKKYYT